jgi:hypothetical protein
MKLIVAIPERWDDAASPVTWALVRPDGTLASEGEGLIADLPAAKRTTLVVAASRCCRRLPPFRSRRVSHIRGALPTREDRPRIPNGAVVRQALRSNRQSVAVIEREWLRGRSRRSNPQESAPDW